MPTPTPEIELIELDATITTISLTVADDTIVVEFFDVTLYAGDSGKTVRFAVTTAGNPVGTGITDALVYVKNLVTGLIVQWEGVSIASATATAVSFDYTLNPGDLPNAGVYTVRIWLKEGLGITADTRESSFLVEEPAIPETVLD